MWFLKGFVQGVGGLIAVALVMSLILLVVATPIFVCKEIFGKYGFLVGLIFEVVMFSGLLGAWSSYDDQQKE